MKYLLPLLFVFLAISCDQNNDPDLEKISKDNIIAGYSENYVYTDIISDTTISTWEILGEHTLDIDIDLNGRDDFIIKVYYATGISHEISKTTIQPLDNNKIAFADSVPATYENETAFYINLVNGVNYGDTINSILNFKNEELYLKTNSYVILSYSIDESWNNKDYIPVCLDLGNNEIRYGWIKVSNISTREITVESYAINL